MTSAMKRATIYIDHDLHKALRLKAVETSRSISDLVNEAIKGLFVEDVEDLVAFDERANESLISYSDMLKKLKEDGCI